MIMITIIILIITVMVFSHLHFDGRVKRTLVPDTQSFCHPSICLFRNARRVGERVVLEQNVDR